MTENPFALEQPKRPRGRPAKVKATEPIVVPESKLAMRTRELLADTLIPLTKIAERCGLSAVQVANIRDGKCMPNVRACEAIYNVLSPFPLEVK